jgi:hypothetical protein
MMGTVDPHPRLGRVIAIVGSCTRGASFELSEFWGIHSVLAGLLDGTTWGIVLPLDGCAMGPSW